jgi:hypothetical protein
MKNAVFWDVTPYGSFKNRLSEERVVCINRVGRICELLLALFLIVHSFHLDD